MATPKQYDSDAKRQAAYRLRHLASKPPTDAELALLARSLHCVISDATEQGKSVLPASVVGENATQTLGLLIHYLDPEPDPVRYAGKDKPCF